MAWNPFKNTPTFGLPKAGNDPGQWNPFLPFKSISQIINTGSNPPGDPYVNQQNKKRGDLMNLVGSEDASLLTAGEQGSILGGLNLENVDARSVTYEELKKKAKKEYDIGKAKQEAIINTQGKEGAILTGGRGLDFAGKPLATGRDLRGIGGV